MQLVAYVVLTVVCLLLVRLTVGTDTQAIAIVCTLVCGFLAFAEAIHIAERKGR